MSGKPLLSVVAPCYNEALCINRFVQSVIETGLKNIEFVFVDDGSRDETLSIIRDLSKTFPNLHYVSFSRNFGKEAALLAGLQRATGNYIVTMDVDMQDPPNLLPKMLQIISSEDFDCVATRRTSREGEPPIRSWFAKRFYRLMRLLSAIDMVDGARDYRMMTRQVVNSILAMPERNRFTKGIYAWVGFKTKWLEFSNVERFDGETKWSFGKLFLYSLEGIMAFSTMPLQIASILGIGCCGVAFLFLLFLVIRACCYGDPVAGWPSMACLIVFFGGLQLLFVGILGAYLSKTYLETKQRPVYLVKEEK